MNKLPSVLLKRSESSTSLIGTNSFTFTSLEVEEEPAVAEVEVGVVSVLVHQLKQLRVQDLCTEEIQEKELMTLVVEETCGRARRMCEDLTGAVLYLDKRAHVGKVSVHSSSVWKVLIHSLHELGETAEGHGL